jgi:hypothetical protein
MGLGFRRGLNEFMALSVAREGKSLESPTRKRAIKAASGQGEGEGEGEGDDQWESDLDRVLADTRTRQRNEGAGLGIDASAAVQRHNSAAAAQAQEAEQAAAQAQQRLSLQERYLDTPSTIDHALDASGAGAGSSPESRMRVPTTLGFISQVISLPLTRTLNSSCPLPLPLPLFLSAAPYILLNQERFV